ncbi:MAG: peroxiredoxin [Verrucomicrobiae bacterium]|nr:peroxiredoxin [Verrucomicrobiae bacterium]
MQIGQKIPAFTGQAYMPDGSFKEISSADFHGQWLVVFFYPLDWTFVCPTEIRGFGDFYKEFKEHGAEVLAVSTDSHFSHKAWSETDPKKGGLGKMPFPLYSDISQKVSRAFGVLKEEDGIAYRGTFIFNKEGLLQSSTVNALNVGRSVRETIRTLKALQTGGLAPCEWEPGKDLIKA